MWHNFQAYFKLYYNEWIKDEYQQALTDALAAFERGELDEKSNSLTIRQEVTKWFFDVEMAEIQEESREYWVKLNKEIDEENEMWMNTDKDGSDGKVDEDIAENHHISKAEAYIKWGLQHIWYLCCGTYLWFSAPKRLQRPWWEQHYKNFWKGQDVLELWYWLLQILNMVQLTVYHEWVNAYRRVLSWLLCSLFVDVNADGNDLADWYGVETFTETVVQQVGKFAAKVYHQ